MSSDSFIMFLLCYVNHCFASKFCTIIMQTILAGYFPRLTRHPLSNVYLLNNRFESKQEKGSSKSWEKSM